MRLIDDGETEVEVGGIAKGNVQYVGMSAEVYML